MAINPVDKNNGTSDEELMRLSGRGDKIAFELLYDRYYDKLVWFAGGFLRDTAMAEDAVQEVFMKIIEKPESFDRSRKFSTWIYTVTGNHCRNILRNDDNRRRIINENSHPHDNHTEMQHSFDDRQLKERINAALKNMSEKEQNIYRLRFEEELSIREIAAIIMIPEGSVKSGIFHFLKKISIHLKDFTNAK
jgi:RNA polymerase sigma-70 factor (ECF subfamily)